VVENCATSSTSTQEGPRRTRLFLRTFAGTVKSSKRLTVDHSIFNGYPVREVVVSPITQQAM
jgi:hypothetical protein